MYTRLSLFNYIFFDIETKPKYNSFDDIPINLQKLWLEKYHFKAFEKEIENRKKKLEIDHILNKTPKVLFEDIIIPTLNEIYIKESGLIPEYSEVYCISFGFFDPSFNPILSTFACDTEKETIESFMSVLHHYHDKHFFGYNTNEFDIPYLLKRMWINGLCSNYPPQLQLKDSKPWTIKHQDHMVNYKAGSWSNVSLGLLCEVFEIPTPKDEFDNSEFTTLLMSGKITKAEAVKYCEKDVKALMELVLKVSSNNSNYEPLTPTKIWPSKTK